MATYKRHTGKLMAKATTHEVQKIDDHTWSVISGSSGKVYEVHHFAGNYQCSCKFGSNGGQNYLLKNSGCSHTAAVVADVAADDGRRVKLHEGEEAAKRQHRPVVHLGQGLYVTTRVAAH